MFTLYFGLYPMSGFQSVKTIKKVGERKTEWVWEWKKVAEPASFISVIPPTCKRKTSSHVKMLKCAVQGFHNNCFSHLKLNAWCWCKYSKLTNHRVYQKLVYWNEVFKTMLTGSPTFLISQNPTVFRSPTFLLSPLTKRLAQAIWFG